MNEEFEKITRVKLPFDMKVAKKDGNNYGIGGLWIWFILKGSKGAVQFTVSFPQYLPHVEADLKVRGLSSRGTERIMGVDLGYHSPKPMYESQWPHECDILDGGRCHYDGSSLRADDWAREIFAIKGEQPEDELWRRLEQEYCHRFESPTLELGS